MDVNGETDRLTMANHAYVIKVNNGEKNIGRLLNGHSG